MPKTTKELEQELDVQVRKRFLEDYEQMTKDLSDKHLMRMIPIIHYAESGALPVFAVQKIKREIVKPETPNENSNQPETDGQSDSDNQVPQK